MPFLRSISGALMLLESIFGSACFALVVKIGNEYYDGVTYYNIPNEDIVFLTVVFYCLATTLLMMLTSSFHTSTALLLQQTAFYLVYHVLATILYLCACIAVFIGNSLQKYPVAYATTAAAVGLINTASYATHTGLLLLNKL